MNKFLAALDRLSSEFADDLVQAVREAPTEEVYRLIGRERPVPVAAEPPASTKRPTAKRPPAAAKRVAPTKPATETKAVSGKAAPKPARAAAPSPHTEQLVRRYFLESGRRGATAQQVQRHLEHDETDPRIPQLLGVLTRDGIIKDAGFRRTTGNGTQPVYVIVPQS